jgi:hypothetical protein
MNSSAVKVRDGRGEYTPTPKELRANALRLARDAQRAATRDEWFKKQGAGATTVTLREALYRDALAGLAEVMQTSDEPRIRLEAQELVINHELECQKLTAELNGKLTPAAQAEREHHNVLKPEQAEEVLAQRRHFLAKVANEVSR